MTCIVRAKKDAIFKNHVETGPCYLKIYLTNYILDNWYLEYSNIELKRKLLQ